MLLFATVLEHLKIRQNNSDPRNSYPGRLAEFLLEIGLGMVGCSNMQIRMPKEVCCLLERGTVIKSALLHFDRSLETEDWLESLTGLRVGLFTQILFRSINRPIMYLRKNTTGTNRESRSFKNDFLWISIMFLWVSIRVVCFLLPAFR